MSFTSAQHTNKTDSISTVRSASHTNVAKNRPIGGATRRGCSKRAKCEELLMGTGGHLEAREAPSRVPNVSQAASHMSEPERTGCTLHFMRERLYLYSWFAATEHVLLSHWLRHYIVGLGVLPNHTSILLHAGDGWLAASASANGANSAIRQRTAEHVESSRAVLVHFGVSSTRVDHERYMDSRRYADIRAHLMTLPIDAWAIYADSDEFFSFPCRMPKILPFSEYYCGFMMDRLAADGTFPPLRAHPDISVQYSQHCALRQQYNKLPAAKRQGFMFTTHKTALFRVRRSSDGALRYLRNSHSLSIDGAAFNMTGGTCPIIGPFAHYTLSASAVEALEQKAEMRVQEARAARAGHREASPIHCQVQSATGCPDYAGLLPFLRAQRDRPWRDLYPLCWPADDYKWGTATAVGTTPESDSPTAEGMRAPDSAAWLDTSTADGVDASAASTRVDGASASFIVPATPSAKSGGDPLTGQMERPAAAAHELSIELPVSDRNAVIDGIPYQPTTQRVTSWARSSGTVMRAGNLFAVGRAAVVFAACCGGRAVLPKQAVYPSLPVPTVNAFNFRFEAHGDRPGPLLMPSQCKSRAGEAALWWVPHGRAGLGTPIDPPPGCTRMAQQEGVTAFQLYARLVNASSRHSGDTAARSAQCPTNTSMLDGRTVPLDQTLVMHFRTGDVFPPPGFLNPFIGPYAQPPLAFYLAAWHHSSLPYALIIAQDARSPAVQVFHAFALDGPLASSVGFRVGTSSFAEDLRLLSCAPHLVLSYSTLADLLAAQPHRTLYSFAFNGTGDRNIPSCSGTPRAAPTHVDAWWVWKSALPRYKWGASSRQQLGLLADPNAAALVPPAGHFERLPFVDASRILEDTFACFRDSALSPPPPPRRAT